MFCSSNVTSGNPDSDLEKAIALSLKESKKGSGPGTSSLYPQMAGMSSSQSAPSTGSSNNFSNSSLMPSAQPAGRQVKIACFCINFIARSSWVISDFCALCAAVIPMRYMYVVSS